MDESKDVARPINDICPWSGQPVQADSLTEYRGHLVGFCNPGCRDKFAAAIDAFEAQLRGGAYERRRMLGLGTWTVGVQQLKVYGIHRDAEVIEKDWVGQAQHYAERTLPSAVATEGHAEGVGFAIVHRGEKGLWLLLHWWAHVDICCQHLAYRDLEPAGRFRSVDDRPLFACVWEQRIIEFERDAWMRHGMSEAAAEIRRARYLDDRMLDGRY